MKIGSMSCKSFRMKCQNEQELLLCLDLFVLAGQKWMQRKRWWKNTRASREKTHQNPSNAIARRLVVIARICSVIYICSKDSSICSWTCFVLVWSLLFLFQPNIVVDWNSARTINTHTHTVNIVCVFMDGNSCNAMYVQEISIYLHSE